MVSVGLFQGNALTYLQKSFLVISNWTSYFLPISKYPLFNLKINYSPRSIALVCQAFQYHNSKIRFQMLVKLTYQFTLMHKRTLPCRVPVEITKVFFWNWNLLKWGTLRTETVFIHFRWILMIKGKMVRGQLSELNVPCRKTYLYTSKVWIWRITT